MIANLLAYVALLWIGGFCVISIFTVVNIVYGAKKVEPPLLIQMHIGSVVSVFMCWYIAHTMGL